MRKTTKRNIASRNILIYFLSFAKQFKTYVFVFSYFFHQSQNDRNLITTMICFVQFHVSLHLITTELSTLLYIYCCRFIILRVIYPSTVKFHWTFLSLSSSKENYYLIHTQKYDVSIGWNQKISLQRAYCRWEWDYVFC